MHISDNCDGTFTNPILWADYPDPDVIRVGDTYYMSSTSMHMMPGCPVMVSKDLVNWKMIGYAIPRMEIHASYNLEEGNRYARGPWATSLRYHNNKFYLCFNTLDEGFFTCISDNPASNWDMVSLGEHLYDPGLFIDNNDRIYVVHGYSTLYITELSSDFKSIKQKAIEIFPPKYHGLEGSHMYQIGTYYYIYCTYGANKGKQLCLRSKTIYGPYEERIVLDSEMDYEGSGVHQGCLVDTPSGEWWCMIFQDRASVGRVPILQPVNWVDDWPIIGDDTKAVLTYRKPEGNSNRIIQDTSDTFEHSELGLQWQWNHNPDNSNWSLTERPGFLRLKAGKVVNNLFESRNILTQRLQGPDNEALVRMDYQGLKNGDMAGMCIFQKPYGFIGIRKLNDRNSLIMVNQGEIIEEIKELKEEVIFLKVVTGIPPEKAHFKYSKDNIEYINIGNTLEMRFSLDIFVGNRVGLFIYATEQVGGYCDFSNFEMKSE